MKTYENTEKKPIDWTSGAYIVKGFARHLMEKSGLLKYAMTKGTTTITITYNADTEQGTMVVISPDPIPTDPPDNFLYGTPKNPIHNS